MKDFFGQDVLLNTEEAKQIYAHIADMPIIDYHCHLDASRIANNTPLDSLARLWLESDHYKWRAMRLCGVDEEYITGNAPYDEKLFKYASIMPRLARSPLYYWTHLELSRIFQINEPLNERTVKGIAKRADEMLSALKTRDLLKRFGVEYIATTDDPTDDLRWHGTYDGITVAPTFRADKLLFPDEAYISRLSESVGFPVTSVAELLRAARVRLAYFKAHGCRIADHGFKSFSSRNLNDVQAETLFERIGKLDDEEKTDLAGYILQELTRIYGEEGIVMQLHFAVTRNVNGEMYSRVGADSGFDVMSSPVTVESVINYLGQIPDEARPVTILYSLNPRTAEELATLSGAFRRVYLGAAWWFNDTVSGIIRNLDIMGEYAVLGTSPGMLTDSRSFASYVRFEFFRRILSDRLGELVNKGEYDMDAALSVAASISYSNIKEVLEL